MLAAGALLVAACGDDDGDSSGDTQPADTEAAPADTEAAPADTEAGGDEEAADMEGFTMMTERLGDLRARDVVRDHNRIVREQLQAQGGSAGIAREQSATAEGRLLPRVRHRFTHIDATYHPVLFEGVFGGSGDGHCWVQLADPHVAIPVAHQKIARVARAALEQD